MNPKYNVDSTGRVVSGINKLGAMSCNGQLQRPVGLGLKYLVLEMHKTKYKNECLKQV